MKSIEHQGKTTTNKAANSPATDGSSPPANGSGLPAHGEATIDQVRDLLFGGAQRSIEGNLAGLREEMQASLKQLQEDFAKELAAVQAKVLELERSTEQKRLASLRDVGTAISQLGTAISGLGSDRAGR